MTETNPRLQLIAATSLSLESPPVMCLGTSFLTHPMILLHWASCEESLMNTRFLCRCVGLNQY